MRSILVHIILLNIVFVYSCNREENCDSQTIFLTEDNMPSIQYLEVERIELPEELFLKTRFLIYQDSILLAINEDLPNPGFLTIMNLQTKKIIGNFYSRGDGPGEVLGIYGYLDHKYLMISDYPTGRKSIFNIDSALILRENYHPQLFNAGLCWDSFCCFSDTSLLVYNQYFTEDAKEFNTNDVTKELFVSDMHGSHEEILLPNDRIFNGSCGAFVRANENIRRIVCAYSRCPKYKFLDYDMNITKVIYGPDDHTNIQYGSYDGLNLGIINGMHSYNTTIASNDNYVFVFNERIIDMLAGLTEQSISQQLIDQVIENGELYQFDWDGNMVGRYKLRDNAILKISISEDSRTLYFTGYNEDRDMCLYKAKLPQ